MQRVVFILRVDVSKKRVVVFFAFYQDFNCSEVWVVLNREKIGVGHVHISVLNDINHGHQHLGAKTNAMLNIILL